MSSDWRCDLHGAVLPLHVPPHATQETLDLVREASSVPLWAPWPLLPGWTVSGVGWVGDDRQGGRATVVACTGPAPLGGVADIVLVCEEPGIGLGARYAGLEGPDPGPALADALTTTAAQAKVTTNGQSTPLWLVRGADGRSAYVGEAEGLWLWAVLWPADAGYLFAEDVNLHDLREAAPGPLIFGVPSPYLNG
ncbi:MAG: hypothetical protein QOC93_3419 [Actinomycetota bacterium]|jgi:hypothetical protein|nr:hypothetical protein [Cryptosporangiaceae bacterium]MDQ1678275.1 hypothetical protein [Actinomycetota bacterium]